MSFRCCIPTIAALRIRWAVSFVSADGTRRCRRHPHRAHSRGRGGLWVTRTVVAPAEPHVTYSSGSTQMARAGIRSGSQGLVGSSRIGRAEPVRSETQYLEDLFRGISERRHSGYKYLPCLRFVSARRKNERTAETRRRHAPTSE